MRATFLRLIILTLATATVVAHLRGSNRAFAQQTREAGRLPVKSQWSGIYSEAQAKRGESTYVENCAACHGADLTGTVGAPPLAGNALSTTWNNRSLSELFEYQQVFMPLNSPNGFTRDKNAEILAYIFKRGNFPAGSSDLPTSTDAQRQVMILAAKP